MPVFNGPMFGGRPAGTPWLRLAYHYDAEQREHDVRMASSTDGTHWTWGGTWSLPVKGKLGIGLVSMGGAGAVASFDYVRTYGGSSRADPAGGKGRYVKPRAGPSRLVAVGVTPVQSEGPRATVRKPALPMEESGVFAERAEFRYRLQ